MTELPPPVIAQIAVWGSLPGWASQDKMRELALIVAETKPELVVEVGVFGGRSALPMIAALARNGEGLFVAIDPYDGKVYDDGQKTDQEAWMRDYDYEPVRRAFLDEIDKFRLAPHASVRRARAATVLPTFADGSIDVFHLDGCHYPDVALADMKLAWPKLAPGATVIIDDTNWNSLAPTLEYLKAAGADLLHDRETYQIFRKPVT